MRRILLALGLLSLLVSHARGDALILKDGRKLSGRVKDNKDSYEITVDAQKLVFTKGEVKRWIKSATEILREADADAAYEEADKIYLEAIEINDQAGADARLREGFPLALKARDAYVEAAELFPAWTSPMVLKVLRLVKKYRAHMGSQLAYTPPVPVKEAPPAPKPKPSKVAPAPKVEPKPEPVKVSPLADALSVLVDPARRAKTGDRDLALKRFRQVWTAGGEGADLAAAGYLFLSKPEADWDLKEGEPALAALQEFFTALGPKDLETLPEEKAVPALMKLASKTKEIGGRFMDGAGESLVLFLSAASSTYIGHKKGKPASDLEEALLATGFKKHPFAAIWGTEEGLALDDYRKWVSSKDYELGFIEFRSDYKRSRDFSVKYARGLLALFKALKRNDEYSRAAVEFELLARTSKGDHRSHVLALAKSIRAKSPCRACAGTHKVNCSACKGKKKLNLECKGCGGSGKINSLRGIVKCRHCKGVGIYRNVNCPKCKASGKTDCRARSCKKPVPAPTFETFADAYKCSLCMGKGSLLRNVTFTCPDCQGVGILLRPSSDPSKTISTQDAR